MVSFQSTACFVPSVLSILLFCITWRETNCAQDLTMTPDATGCDVAKAAYDKMTSSLIFKKQENFILPRVALVSKFGASITVQGGVGIWQMNQANLDQAQSNLVTLNYTLDIASIICIEFDKATLEDLKKPMFNVVAVALLIEGSGDDCPIRGDVDGQLDFWVSITGNSLSGFEEAATTLDKNDGSQGTECFQCIMMPTDVTVILDTSGSVNDNEWELEVLFVQSVLDQLADSMADGDSQASGVIFSSDATTHGYTSDATELIEFCKSGRTSHGNTMIPLALEKTRDLIVNDANTRINDNSIKKLVFFLTDGKTSTEDMFDTNALKLKSLPLTVYAIGTMNNAEMDQLQIIASHPNYARKYTDFDQFQSDIPSILLEGCLIGTSISGGAYMGSAASLVPQDVNTTEFTIADLSVGETRYYTVAFQIGTISNFKVSPSELDLTVYASFNNEYPSEANYDFKTECTGGTDCTVLVKDPNSFLNDICKQTNVVKEPETYNTAITATGPDGAGSEDVPGSVTVKEDIESNWEDYSEADELLTEQAGQVYNQSVRWAKAAPICPIRKYILSGVFVSLILIR